MVIDFSTETDRRVGRLGPPPSGPHPERRGPRPLALHIARAEWAWRTGDPHRLADFYRGITAYRHHPYRRALRPRPTIWNHGDCRLLDYGPDRGWPVLVVPSLINRAYILDLMPGASLLDFLRDQGIRPLLLDWGDGTRADKHLSLDQLILERLKPAFDFVRHRTERRPFVLGYCMGGVLAVALACRRQEDMTGLALLATPWDFSDRHVSERLAPCLDALERGIGGIGAMPVDLLQALFVDMAPMDVPRKFARFARIARTSAAATRFVAIEDWLNDGIALGADVAAECFQVWCGRNAPSRGQWLVDGDRIDPTRLDLPSCAAIPERDRIVPPGSALALAEALEGCDVIRPRAGHVSMIAGNNAEATLWQPLVIWLKEIAAMQKSPW